MTQEMKAMIELVNKYQTGKGECMTKYQLYYNEIIVGTFDTEELAMKSFYEDKKQFKDLNNYVRTYKIDNVTTIDFGSHSNLYYIVHGM